MCRSLRALSNEYLNATIGVDTAAILVFSEGGVHPATIVFEADAVLKPPPRNIFVVPRAKRGGFDSVYRKIVIVRPSVRACVIYSKTPSYSDFCFRKAGFKINVWNFSSWYWRSYFSISFMKNCLRSSPLYLRLSAVDG